MKKLLLLLLTTVCLYGTGCMPNEPENKKNPFAFLPDQPLSALKTETMPLPNDAERRSLKTEDGREITFLLVGFERDHWSWDLAEDTVAPKTVKEWRDRQKTDCAVNAAYFDESMQPAGFFQKANTSTQSRIPWPDEETRRNPNGYTGLVKINNGDLFLKYLPEGPHLKPNPDEDAFLTFPTLLFQHKSQIKEESEKYAERTALAMTADGEPYLIFTEQGLVSLFELAEWIAEQPEDFEIAINLDGGSSRGIACNKTMNNLHLPSAPVPNVLLLRKNR